MSSYAAILAVDGNSMAVGGSGSFDVTRVATNSCRVVELGEQRNIAKS